MICWRSYYQHDDVNKWKHFPRYWPFVRGIHRSPVNFLHKSQWRRALMFSLICTWINSWVNYREAGDLRRHRAHYDVIVMKSLQRSSDPREIIQTMLLSWWRHGTDAFSALLTICREIQPGSHRSFPLQRSDDVEHYCCHWHQPCMIKYSYTSYQNLVRWPFARWRPAIQRSKRVWRPHRYWGIISPNAKTKLWCNSQMWIIH